MEMKTTTTAKIIGYKIISDKEGNFKGLNVYTLHAIDDRGKGYEPKEWYSKDDLLKHDLKGDVDFKKEYTLEILISTFKEQTYTRLVGIK